jgi:putative peptidoglycan lipid II flippase
VAGHGLLEVLARAFYALEDTWTPVLVGVVAMAANITLSLLLISRMGDPGDLGRGPFAGLALANSLTTLAEAAVLWLLLRRRLGGINDRAILRGGAASLLAALGMGAAIVFAEDALTQVPPLVGGAIGLLAGALVFLALAVLFRLEEARTVPAALLRRFRR